MPPRAYCHREGQWDRKRHKNHPKHHPKIAQRVTQKSSNIQRKLHRKMAYFLMILDLTKKASSNALCNPWWLGIVVIASASRTEDSRFESRQSVRFLGLYQYIAVLLSET
jgi:hypothetical protein